MLVVGEHVLEVDEPPRIGRAPVAQAEGLPGEAQLGDRGGNRRHEQAPHRERAEMHEQRDVAEQREHVLHELKERVTTESGRTRPRGARGSACRKTPSPRSGAARA